MCCNSLSASQVRYQHLSPNIPSKIDLLLLVHNHDSATSSSLQKEELSTLMEVE